MRGVLATQRRSSQQTKRQPPHQRNLINYSATVFDKIDVDSLSLKLGTYLEEPVCISQKADYNLVITIE